MIERFAIDTNVLVYLHDSYDTPKREKAIELMAMSPIISGQVISEYINVLRRILKISKTELLQEVTSWLQFCEIFPIDFSTLEHAHALILQYDFQLFDALIVASAIQAECTILYSEDMKNGLLVDDQLTICNPFL
ncbi:MAG: PIN domain-containing protein [Microscillaceae bacterium]|nr:PIN domain-containing protein [Microscillaceae bacterium]